MGKKHVSAPVLVLVWAHIGIMVVKNGQVKAGIEKLIATRPQQPNSIIFALPNILLKIQEIQPHVGMQRRPEHNHVVANIR